jgi:hypothetical protein
MDGNGRGRLDPLSLIRRHDGALSGAPHGTRMHACAQVQSCFFFLLEITACVVMAFAHHAYGFGECICIRLTGAHAYSLRF